MHNALVFMAMGGQPTGGSETSNPLAMMFPLVLMGLIFYFMLIRPQQRREKERKALVDSVKTGDNVVFGAGMLGMVTNVKERTLMVRIADNVKVEVLRESISRVLAKDEKPAEKTE